MATTKIRRISSYTLWAVMAISVVVILAFFFGGSELDAKGNVVYNNTSLMMYWTYILAALTIIATLLGACSGFASSPKKGIRALGGVLVLVVILAVSYFMGDDTPLQTLNKDNQAFNTAFWLKLTDMFIYTTYVMSGLVVLAILWGSLKKAFDR